MTAPGKIRLGDAIDDLDAIEYLTEALFMACISNLLEKSASNALQSLVNEIAGKLNALNKKLDAVATAQEGGAE